MSPATYAYNNPEQAAFWIASGVGLAVAAPITASIGAVALGSYAVGTALYNAATAPNADTRDYYLGQGTSIGALTAIGAKSTGAADTNPATLYHYTSQEGLQGILNSGKLNASLKANNPSDAFYGEGQYFSDIAPGTMTNNQLSRQFINNPFQGNKFSQYLEINVSNLDITKGRSGVYVNHSTQPLNIKGLVKSSGSNQK